jgi:hypothetical protein
MPISRGMLVRSCSNHINHAHPPVQSPARTHKLTCPLCDVRRLMSSSAQPAPIMDTM